MSQLKPTCALFTLLALSPTATAQMMGAAMDAEWIYPSFPSVLENHAVTVTTAVELPSNVIVNDSKYEVDIGDDWIEFRFNATSHWTASGFNGWRFRDSMGSIPAFSDYTVDSFSAGVTNVAGIVLGFNDDEVWANFGGVSFAGNGDWIRLKVEMGGMGTAFCLGDGSDTPCPCGNVGASGEGCVNSSALGAILTPTGSLVAAANDLVLTGTQLPPGVPSLFFSGVNAIAPAALFGDGLRCAGGQLTRLEIVFADNAGSAATSIGIAASLGAVPGTRSIVQLWYRDPQGPCGGMFNTTGALDITWQ